MINKKGFTLIEFIIYIALLSIIMAGLIRFGWDIAYSRVKSNTQKDTVAAARMAAKRIAYEIRNASSSGIISLSASDLCLRNAESSRNPTRIYLSGGRLNIAWGGGGLTCVGMTSEEPITGNGVTVSSLTFTNLSSGSASLNIGYSLTVDANNPGAQQEYSKSVVASGAAEIRSN